MVSEATRELFALVNVMCGGGILLLLVGYLLFARPRRAAITLALLLICLLCVLNSFVIYFLS